MDKTKLLLYGLACIILALSIFTTKFYFDKKAAEKQVLEWKSEAYKYGEYKKISDSLSSYLARIDIAAWDSTLKANKDITAEMKKLKENPITIIKYKTVTEVDTFWAHTEPLIDSTWRRATVDSTITKGWYDFAADYQVVKPWGFKVVKFKTRDVITLVESELENGRKKVYFKNANPFSSIQNPEVILEPNYLEKQVEVKSWKYNFSLSTYTPFQSDFKGYQKLFTNYDLNGGIYAPFGLGLTTGVTILEGNSRPKIGLGFIGNF